MAAIVGIVQLGKSFYNNYMTGQYMAAVRQVGAVPIVLPWAATEKEAEEALFSCSGLLLPGGGDIDPKLYGKQQTDAFKGIEEARDQSEILYFHKAEQRGMPVLGIGRGCQLIGVLTGGTLTETEVLCAEERHAGFAIFKKKRLHTVIIEEDSRLGTVCEKECAVNSLHRHAIGRVSDRLLVTAKSPGGVIEAVEGRGERFVMGVQWHPEFLCRKDSTQRKILKLFAKAAEQFAMNRYRRWEE